MNKNISQINKKKGVSIVETIIYLAIFSAMSIVVINSFIVIISSLSAIRINHNLLTSGSMSMERISREIRQSKSIDLVNTTSSSLQLNSTDGSGSDMVIKFVKEGNALNIYKNGVIIGNLLSSNVILDSLSFDRISTTNSEGVKIKMTIEQTLGKRNKISNFYNTVILRN